MEAQVVVAGQVTVAAVVEEVVAAVQAIAAVLKDKNKHYADIKKFGSYKFGFMVRNAHRFRTPMPYPGRLRFFEVQYPFS